MDHDCRLRCTECGLFRHHMEGYDNEERPKKERVCSECLHLLAAASQKKMKPQEEEPAAEKTKAKSHQHADPLAVATHIPERRTMTATPRRQVPRRFVEPPPTTPNPEPSSTLRRLHLLAPKDPSEGNFERWSSAVEGAEGANALRELTFRVWFASSPIPVSELKDILRVLFDDLHYRAVVPHEVDVVQTAIIRSMAVGRLKAAPSCVAKVAPDYDDGILQLTMTSVTKAIWEMDETLLTKLPILDQRLFWTNVYHHLRFVELPTINREGEPKVFDPESYPPPYNYRIGAMIDNHWNLLTGFVKNFYKYRCSVSDPLLSKVKKEVLCDSWGDVNPKLQPTLARLAPPDRSVSSDPLEALLQFCTALFEQRVVIAPALTDAACSDPFGRTIFVSAADNVSVSTAGNVSAVLLHEMAHNFRQFDPRVLFCQEVPSQAATTLGRSLKQEEPPLSITAQTTQGNAILLLVDAGYYFESELDAELNELIADEATRPLTQMATCPFSVFPHRLVCNRLVHRRWQQMNAQDQIKLEIERKKSMPKVVCESVAE